MTAAALARRQHRGPQATRRRRRRRAAPSRDARARPGSRTASSRSSTAAPRPARRSSARRSTASRSPARPRSGARSRGELPEGPYPAAGARGDGRQERRRSSRRERRPRSRRRGHRQSRLRALGPEVQRLLARDRGGRGPRRARRAARGAHRATCRVGDPADPRRPIGPVVERAGVERFERPVEAARRDGRVVAGGERPTRRRLLRRADRRRRPAARAIRSTRDELFLPFVTVDARAGSSTPRSRRPTPSRTGSRRASSREDEAELDRFLDEIEAGVVYVNRRAGATTGAWPGTQSFCGWKSSGSTGKGGLGPYYVPQFMREQSRTIVAQ